jgi:hypothetical protein
MTSQRIFSYVIYLFACIGFISVFQYAYQNRTGYFPSFLSENNQHLNLIKTNFSSSNLLLQHIDKCPECVLYLLQENETIFNVLNSISIHSQATFYPLTMNLFYNKPIPYYTILSNNQTEITIKIRRYWIDYIKKMNGVKPNTILEFILRSLEKPIEIINHSWPKKTKLILYYTKFFGNNYWYNKDENEVYSNDFHTNNCPISVNACRVTIDHKLFSKSDASLIHIRESINYEKLNSISRRSNQKMVFFLKESPVHSPVLSSKTHGQIFNYTQTYRPDSDITATTLRNFFWLFSSKIYPNYDFKSIIKTKISGKILVAIISNCGGSSNRLNYINALKEYISVDVYGKCGKSCPNVPDCRQHVYSTYKFYLAFENSLCDEYVTEKFFFALHSARIVPVVFGLARYDRYIPSTGYIDVRNFTSPRVLAAYINYLDQNTTAYLEYFQWRQYALHIKLPKYMCELCLKLFLDDRDHKQQSLEHIDDYWNTKQCHTYTKKQNDTWILQ